MIINSKDYADFKSICGALRHIDCVFYNLSRNLTPQTSGGSYFFIYAFDFQAGVSVQCLVNLGATPVPPSSSAQVLADFPSAVALNDYLILSPLIVSSGANAQTPYFPG